MTPDIDELSISQIYPKDSLVTPSSVLHKVKHPKLVGRINWEWERNQEQGNSTKEFGVKANRKPTFEMKARRRQVRGVIVVVEYYIILVIIVVVLRVPRTYDSAAEGVRFLK